MQFAPLYPLIYRVLQPTFPRCLWTGDRCVKEVALTFDDGPDPRYTPQLLEVLDRYGIKASFFWLGVCVERSPETAQAICQQGHWIGLHGYTHRMFNTLSPLELYESLEKTKTLIAQTCGLSPQTLRDVRPPNGVFTPQILRWLHDWNYRPVMWSVVPEDWLCPGVSIVVQRVLQQVEQGSVIVLHDGACGGADVAATVEQLIPALLQRGYQFVTIDQLWQFRSSEVTKR